MSGENFEMPVWRNATNLKNREIYCDPHIISPYGLRDLSNPQRVISLKYGYTDIGSYEGSIIRLRGDGIKPNHASIRIIGGSSAPITIYMRKNCQVIHRRDEVTQFFNYSNDVRVLKFGDIITFGSDNCFKLIEIKYIAGN